MKKVLWIACLLCLIPFLGIAQNRAGLAMQDESAGFDQAPVSKELPATFQLKNGTRGDTIADFHAMFVPALNSNYGRYYHITLVGSTAEAKVVKRYNDWYYSAADYYYNAEENSTAPDEPVWAYANDYTKGFMNLNFVTGAYTTSQTPINLSMNDITYDYNHGYMLGMKNGIIYELTLATNEGPSGEVRRVMYNYADHDGLKPIAIAADLDGTLYFVSLSPDGDQTSSLYKMEYNTNGTFKEPEEIGNLEWPAYHIQTMAFDHNTRRLFWWACDINGNTMLKEIDKETAACTDYIPVTEDEEYQPGTQTEMAGLIFEFAYVDHTATCINTEGTLLLDNGQTVNQYKPGANVNVTVTAPACNTLDYLVVLNANDHNDTIVVIPNDELVNGVGTFAMPACDVDVDAVWSGNEHNITITVTPSSMQSQITTTPSGTGECGNVITINYGHPTGWLLSNTTLKAKNGSHNNTVTVSSGNIWSNNTYHATFTMPDANVKVTGTYVQITVDTIEGICQWKPLDEVPEFHCSNANESGYTLEYWFKKPGGSFKKLTEAQMLNGNTFDKAGTWQYYVKVTNMYGEFRTATLSFTVTAAPKSIALAGNQYNCEGDSIVLTVVPTPANATLTGLFTWKKDGEEVATTDVPKLVIDPCTGTNAGYYAVEFAPGATDNEPESACTLADSLYKVNVSSIPNKPEIGLQDGGDDVCFNSSAILEWKNGVLDPDAYIIQWYTITYVDSIGDTVWTAIPNANAQTYTTPALDTVAPFVYGLSIRYQGVNNLCHRESDPDTVWVREQEVVEIMGDLETCKGFIPGESPYVDESYTNVVWKFNGTTILENSNVLDFENLPQLGTWLQEVDTLVLEVQAENSESTCTAYGTYDFVIKPLPEVIITNNITDDTAHYDDSPVLTINICVGDKVVLTASGADEYRWGDAKDDEEPVEAPVSEMTYWPEVSTTYSVSGYSEETGCWNTTSIRVVVNQKPEITWIHPGQPDTIFSMITDAFELQATPAGGLFTYVIPSEPDVDYPILDEEGNPTNIFNPSALGLGEYQLIYSFQNENGCRNEERVNIEIIKPYWSDTTYWDPNWYQDCTDAGQWEINNPHQMGSFIAYVYGLNGVEKTDFSGVTIYLTNDIDLQEEPVFYRPFCDTAQFNGTFDGAAQIISNMVILEEDLQMNIMGTIRNVGFKDAKITNTTSETVIDVVEGAQFHNCFITMPTLNNVTPNFQPTGEVRNVYYVGPKDGEEAHVYMDNAAETPVYIEPVENDALLHKIDAEEENTVGNLEGILEEWVWLQNDFNYYTWKLDDPDLQMNYGWPIFETSFEHHHYIVVDEYDEGTHSFNGTAQERDINGEHYTYAMNNDEVTITFYPDQYVIFDTIAIIAHDYREEGIDIDIEYTYADNSFTFTMPADSVYEPAYWVEIIPMPRRDYWTDEGNYNETWYESCEANGRFEITSNRDLAALAWEVDFNGHDFDSITVYIEGGVDLDPLRDNVNENLVNMAGHFWRPIYGFRGVLDGTHFIVDSLYIRENYEGSMAPYANAMFVDLQGVVRNLGVQDIDLPEGSATIARYDVGEAEEEEMEFEAAAIAVDYRMGEPSKDDPTTGETTEPETEFVEEPGVYNSFVTINPELHMQYEIAGSNIFVDNSYTLDPNGNMIDGNHEFIDFADLRAWVAEQNAAAGYTEGILYYDWILDELPINYYYPIHDPNMEPGFNITYIPGQDDVDDPDNHGYVGGPTIGHEGEIITVESNPDYCYNMTQLWLIDGNDSIDIKDTKQFEMPDHAVTVYGVFTPIEWTFTINYLDVNGEPLEDVEPYVSSQHYNDSLTIESPVIEGMEPDMPVVDTVMPCDNLTINVTYDGEKHQITFCPDMYADEEDEDGNLMWAEWIEEVIADDSARYTHEVTVTIVPKAGLSLGNVTITNLADKTDVEYTNEPGSYAFTFTMPLGDVEICAEPTEEYWDDWSIADISWFVNHEDDDTYILTTDSMLGGLAALVTGRDWLYNTEYEWLFDPEHGYYTEEEAQTFNFQGKTIIIESAQEEGMIDLIEHKWRPIGAQLEFTHWFQGYFDGNGHKIVNMTTADLSLLDEPGNGSCQAFFGNVGVNAVINDLDIQGTAQGRYFTAGIAGVNKGKIINSVSRVVVRSEYEAGGIAANNFGEIYNCYTAVDSIECWSAAPLRGDDNPNNNNYYVGGIAAYNTSIIENCHSVARLVMGHGNNPIHHYGALVGMNEGEVKNSFWMVNPIEDAIGGGDAAINCALISNNTSSMMTTNAQAIGEIEGHALFNWTDDSVEGYPIFDRDAKAIMSVNNSELNASVYPNPTSGYVKVECEGMQRVMVFNMFGQLMLDNQVNDNMTELQLNGFAAGVYTVRIVTANGMVTRNVVVE